MLFEFLCVLSSVSSSTWWQLWSASITIPQILGSFIIFSSECFLFILCFIWLPCGFYFLHIVYQGCWSCSVAVCSVNLVFPIFVQCYGPVVHPVRPSMTWPHALNQALHKFHHREICLQPRMGMKAFLNTSARTSQQTLINSSQYVSQVYSSIDWQNWVSN